MLVARIAPELLADSLMHGLGKSFGKPVGQRLDHNRGIIVIGTCETLGNCYFLNARGHHEAADIVRFSARDRRNKIRQCYIGPPVSLGELLAQCKKCRKLLASRIVLEDANVVADRVRRPKADHGLWLKPALGQDFH